MEKKVSWYFVHWGARLVGTYSERNEKMLTKWVRILVKIKMEDQDWIKIHWDRPALC